MPSTWSKVILHVVVATKGRREFITPALRERLDPYIGGIIRDLGGTLYQAGGVEDHSHFLVRWGTDRSIGDLMRHVKSRSSKWIHQAFPELRRFAWQEGYGVFSVSESKVEEVTGYIRRQAQHHKKQDFKAELLALLRKHKVEYDERYLFD